MSWLVELAKVYDNTQANADKPIPMFHTANNASATIMLDGDGNFIKAELVKKTDTDRVTIMPCTESCSNRTSGADAYPLCDKLEYVVGNETKYNLYKNLLEAWANSQYGTKKVKAVLAYVSSKTLIQDLEKSQISQDDISDFIRWEVQIPGDKDSCLWKDPVIQTSWINFYNSSDFEQYCKTNFAPKDAEKRIRKSGLDYVDGEMAKIAAYHPSKIRNAGSSAKIISSNDTNNYTFRGRFLDDSEACQISSDITQKAHSALRWLIKRQGVALGEGLSIVTWNEAGTKIPPLTASSTDLDWDYGDDVEKEDGKGVYQTSLEFAKAINNRLQGYYGNIEHPERIMVMAIKEATPGQGRVSITLYRELQNSDFLAALENWYTKLSWDVTYWPKKKKEKGEKKTPPIHTTGTPSPKTITECAYGEQVNAKLVEKTVLRILPCILDGNPIPQDLETQCVKSASNLLTIENYRRSIVLETACAVYKYNRITKDKEEYTMALEEDRTSRDYLYGRLLAVAQQLENAALQKMQESRETNAVRYMQQFSIKPATTWKILYEKKLPAYKKQLEPGLREWFERKIQDITALFKTDDYINDKALSGEYLLGYHCQLKSFRTKSDGSNGPSVENMED